MPVRGSAERVTVVSCRSWPVVGCGHRLDDLVVVVSANRVQAVSQMAEQLGIKAGMSRREAQRRAPGVEVLAPDIAGESRAFEPILRCLEDITPRIEIERPGMCQFLTRGPSRYFGGDQAMSTRVAQLVADELAGRSTVQVGTADSRFGAMQAAATAPENSALVIESGQSAEFLAPFPVAELSLGTVSGPFRKELDDLVGVLERLGLSRLGDFAALSAGDVVARFGAVGVRAHQWANGVDHRPGVPKDLPANLEVAIELDPPIGRVDQAAFIARTLANEFIRLLQSRGVSCARVAIQAETEHGEQQLRLWRSEEAFSAAAISDRMRWQLDGWLTGPERSRPSGGLSRLALSPDDLSVAAGRQLGFWGEQSGLAERAARAVARVQGLAGVGTVAVPELQGGRSPADVVTMIPAEAVDLVERAACVDRKLIGAQSGGSADGVSGERADLPWPGSVPGPAPAVLYRPAPAVVLSDCTGSMVKVLGRGIVSKDPADLRFADGAPVKVTGWSGPWLLDERWWHVEQSRRSARMQVMLEDGRALLLASDSGAWVVEACYD